MITHEQLLSILHYDIELANLVVTEHRDKLHGQFARSTVGSP
jgi:hypothetical protein